MRRANPQKRFGYASRKMGRGEIRQIALFSRAPQKTIVSWITSPRANRSRDGAPTVVGRQWELRGAVARRDQRHALVAIDRPLARAGLDRGGRLPPAASRRCGGVSRCGADPGRSRVAEVAGAKPPDRRDNRDLSRRGTARGSAGLAWISLALVAPASGGTARHVSRLDRLACMARSTILGAGSRAAGDSAARICGGSLALCGDGHLALRIFPPQHSHRGIAPYLYQRDVPSCRDGHPRQRSGPTLLADLPWCADSDRNRGRRLFARFPTPTRLGSGSEPALSWSPLAGLGIRLESALTGRPSKP